MNTTFIQNMGCLKGPILVFGGPYSNLAATQAMKQKVEQLGLLSSQVICTGDVVAYCAEPEATVELLRRWGIHVVLGNCEESLGSEAPDCGCGFEMGTVCSALSNDWYRFAAQRVGSESKAWMRNLPRSIGFELNGRTFLVVHGGVEQINRFIFTSTPAEDKWGELDLAATDGVIAGHCGLPFGQHINDKVWLNAGVIGMPANDGTRDGWYMLLKSESNQIRITWHRLSYDAERSHRSMQEAGLSKGYTDALLSGLWPSQDVLPGIERSQQGQPINPQPLFFMSK
ncbi:MAG: metallophosphoesterase family protein [Desulfobacteraceae bacterium]|nr:metallophosphoesterase family protein [Desulfobacteraceae bacterium]